MRTFVFGASLVLALSLPTALSAQDPRPATPSATAWDEFLRTSGGDWVAQWHAATGTPSAIYGTGLPLAGWRENSLEEARRHAVQVLRDRADLLGLGTSDFRESIGARMGRTWSFTFEQSFRGVPVIDGRADVRISMRGVVAMLGSRAWPIPATFDVTPAVAEEVAAANAWDALGAQPTGATQPGKPRAPRLVIWGDIKAPALAPVHLAWEVPISNVAADGSGPVGRYYIDAKTGAVLRYENDKHECGLPGCTVSTHGVATAAAPASAAPPIATTVTVTAWTRTGNDAFSALVNTPLRGIVLNVPGIGLRTTDVNGQFTIDINAPVNITVGALDGTHHAPIAGASAPSGVFAVSPGVNATIQLLTAAATVDEAAHTTTAYWVDRTNEFCRGILGNTAQLNTASAIAPTVNIADTCNAYYTNNTINFYQSGNGCSNTAFSTVVAHEWGHGLDARYGGIFNDDTEGVSEGWGDIIGMYLVNSPLLGSGFLSPGQPLRNGNNNRLWPYAVTGNNPPTPHPAGEVWMGFAWRLRTFLTTALGAQPAIDVSNDIVIGSIVANATTRVDAVREVFIADDDDGNLLNGTPHYAQLSAAAIAKNIPYPQMVLGTLAHTPLADTTQLLTPRLVNATVTPAFGSFTQVRLHFNAGSGSVVRNMKPNGLTNGYHALLAGRTAGSVTYHIEALHSSGETARLPATGEFGYTVGFAGFYLANFDAGTAGWTSAQVATQNDWQVGDPAGRFGTSGGVAWADPQTAASAPNCYGNDLGNTINGQPWGGSYNSNVENYLRSPVINCTGRTGVVLRFKRWLTVEEGLYDQATILVNGVQVWQNPQSGHLLDTSWQTVSYPIPMADNNPAVQIEWRLRSDTGLNLGGWNIDDVELGTLASTLPAELRLLPEQAVQGATLTMTVNTPSSSRPFLFAIGDTAGPTVVPGFPTLFVGGALTVVGGSTGPTGTAVFVFPAPTAPSASGMFLYSQVLTLDAGFTQFIASNPFVNLFTQTP